jgi:hypothetical protein
VACSLFDDLRWRRNHHFGLTFIQLNLAGDGAWTISQRPQELFSSDLGNVLRWRETREYLPWNPITAC